MKKNYMTPVARIIEMHVESDLLTASFNGKTPEEGDGSDLNSNRREGFFGGGMWDNM